MDSYAPTDINVLRAAVAKRFLDLGLQIRADGWPGRIDSGLSAESQLSRVALDAIAGLWSPLWADNLFQELRFTVSGLEADSRYFADLNYRLATYIIEQFTQDGELAVHNDEVGAGWLTVAAEIAGLETAAQEEMFNAFQASSAYFQNLLQDEAVQRAFANPRALGEMRAAAVTVASLTPYRKVYVDSIEDSYVEYSEQVLTGGRPIVVDPNGAGARTDAVAAIYNNAAESFALDMAINAATTQAGGELAKGYAASAFPSLNSKQRQLAWSNNDIEFRRRRTQLQIDARALKREAFETAGSPFDYTVELSQLRERFIAMLAQASSKASVVQKGLNLLLGLSLPEPPMPYDWEDGRPSYIIALSEWINLVQFSVGQATQFEAGTILSFSVKRLNPGAWDLARQNISSGATTRFEMALQFPRDAFEAYSRVRLRGLSASVAHATASVDGDSWRGTIQPPANSVYLDAEGGELTVVQAALQSDLARVAGRGASRPPDIVGMSHLRNMSPLSPTAAQDARSAWHLVIERESVFGKDILEVTDVCLDLMVSGLAKPNKNRADNA